MHTQTDLGNMWRCKQVEIKETELHMQINNTHKPY